MKSLPKKSFYLLTGIVSIWQLIDFTIKYKSAFNKLVENIVHLDFTAIGQIVLICGLTIIVITFLLYSIQSLFGIKKPQKSIVVLLGQFILPDDQWKDSAGKYKRKLAGYYFLKFGLILILGGLLIVFVYKFF